MMNHEVFVIGSGGHAKVLIAMLDRLGVPVAGVVDADPERYGAGVLGRPILGDDSVMFAYPPERVELINGIGGTGPAALRAQVQERFTARGYRFRTVIDPSAMVAADVIMGEGVQVMAGAIIQPGVRIGMGAIVNTRAAVDHDCELGDFVHVAPGAVLSGNVRVGARTLVGVGAVVRQGVMIGEAVLIGAGAAVVNDLPAGAVAMGVPARLRG